MSANFFRNLPRLKKVVCLKSEMQILCFYVVWQYGSPSLTCFDCMCEDTMVCYDAMVKMLCALTVDFQWKVLNASISKPQSSTEFLNEHNPRSLAFPRKFANPPVCGRQVSLKSFTVSQHCIIPAATIQIPVFNIMFYFKLWVWV